MSIISDQKVYETVLYRLPLTTSGYGHPVNSTSESSIGLAVSNEIENYINLFKVNESLPINLRSLYAAQYYKVYTHRDISAYVIPDNSATESKTEEISGRSFATKIIELQSTIGRDLFCKLNLEQQIFMANTFGSINLGGDVDIEAIYRFIDED